MINKPILIFCLHRSGSTYLSNVIGQSTDVKMLEDEVQFNHPLFRNTFQKIFHRTYKDNFTQFVKELDEINIRGSFWKIFKKEYGLFSSNLNHTNNIDEWRLLNQILDTVRSRSGKPRVGIKYPAHFSYLNQFQTQYPDAKIIFLLRAPEAIIASKLKSPTNSRVDSTLKVKYEFMRLVTVFFFSIEYYFYVRTIIENHKSGYIIHYEHLVEHPVEQIKSICEFCEISFNMDMLSVDGKPSGFEKTDSISDRLTRWKLVLRPYERWIIKAFNRNIKLHNS